MLVEKSTGLYPSIVVGKDGLLRCCPSLSIISRLCLVDVLSSPVTIVDKQGAVARLRADDRGLYQVVAVLHWPLCPLHSVTGDLPSTVLVLVSIDCMCYKGHNSVIRVLSHENACPSPTKMPNEESYRDS